jgi:hypothetical protein
MNYESIRLEEAYESRPEIELPWHVTWPSKGRGAFVGSMKVTMVHLNSSKCWSAMMYFRLQNLALAAGRLNLIKPKCLRIEEIQFSEKITGRSNINYSVVIYSR